MSLFRNRNNDFEDKLRKQLDETEFRPAESLWDRIDAEVNREPFENNVQEKVQSYELQPKPETWEAIEAELPPEPGRRRNRRAVWYGMLVLLFVTGMYAGYELSNQQDQLTGNATTGQTVTGDAAVQEPASAIHNDQQPSSNNISEKDEVNANRVEKAMSAQKQQGIVSSEEEDQPAQEAKQNEQAKASLVPALPKTASPLTAIAPKKETAVLPFEKNIPVKTNSKPAKAASSQAYIASENTSGDNNPATPASKATIVNNNVADVKKDVPKTFAPPTAQQEKETVAAQTKNTHAPTSDIRNVVKEEATANVEKKHDVSADQPAPAKDAATDQQQTSIPSSTSNTSDQAATAKQTSPAVPLPEGVKKLAAADSASQVLITPDKDHANKFEELSNFSISIMAGAHYSFMHLSAPNSETAFDKNIALRSKLEAPQMDMSGGFLLDYTLNDNWMISTGIFFTAFSQRMQYGITTPNGTFIPETGAQYATQDSIVNGNQYTTRIRYTWNEIPVLLTYRSHHMGRFNYEFRGGVSYAVLSSVDAAMISYDNVGLLTIKDKDAFPGFENSFFMHLHGGVTYSINDKVTLGFMPYFRYSLNSMVSRSTWVQQQPYLIGANLMLRRTF